ncbi:MAG: DUF5591 domain-containing protein [Pyrodictiaceae archaeon]
MVELLKPPSRRSLALLKKLVKGYHKRLVEELERHFKPYTHAGNSTKLLKALGLIDAGRRDLLATPLGYYVYKAIKRDLDEKILEAIVTEPGKIIITGENLFFDERVKPWHEYMASIWEPEDGKKIALFTPCSRVKPIPHSFMNRKIDALLSASPIGYMVERLILSEPLAIIPYRYSLLFPAAHYDYPPEKLSREEIEYYIDLTALLLKKIDTSYEAIVYSLPRQHRMIFEKALEDAGVEATYIPYNVYYLPKLKKALEETALRLNGFRVTDVAGEVRIKIS